MCDFAQYQMSKKREQLRALANISVTLAIIGIVMSVFAPNMVIRYIGIFIIFLGFTGGIAFESLEQAELMQLVRKKEMELEILEKKYDIERKAEYLFRTFLHDNNCSMAEFIYLYDVLKIDFEDLYDDYREYAGDRLIQTRTQVKQIIQKERRKQDETA